jgi:quercetin dioxygenase-like cupin family protein
VRGLGWWLPPQEKRHDPIPHDHSEAARGQAGRGEHRRCVRHASPQQGLGRDRQGGKLAGAFAVYGGHGATASSTIVYEIEPGKRLGWHTDATEETQYIIAGHGKLYLEDGSTHAVGPGSVFVLPTPMRHDLENTGKETLRAVAFFAAAMFTQDFDQVMLPPKSHILGTPNRAG